LTTEERGKENDKEGRSAHGFVMEVMDLAGWRSLAGLALGQSGRWGLMLAEL
jgi:hypothetical protein